MSETLGADSPDSVAHFSPRHMQSFPAFIHGQFPAGVAAIQEIRGDRLADGFLHRIAHRTRTEPWKKSASHEKRQHRLIRDEFIQLRDANKAAFEKKSRIDLGVSPKCAWRNSAGFKPILSFSTFKIQVAL